MKLFLKIFLCMVCAMFLMSAKAFAADAESAKVELAKTNQEMNISVASTMKEFKSKLKYKDFDFGTKKELIMPINMDKSGQLLIFYEDDPFKSKKFEEIIITVCADKACTQVMEEMYIYPDRSEDYRNVTIKKAGKYYVKFTITGRKGYKGSISVPLAFLLIPGGTRAIKSGTEYVAYQDRDLNDRYYKVTANKDTLFSISISMYDYDYGHIWLQLLDSDKKALSDMDEVEIFDSEASISYAVPKGTYYIKVHTGAGLYSISQTATAVKNKSGSSKSTAFALSLDDPSITESFLITDKAKTEHWYKVTLASKKTLQVFVTENLSGSTKVEVIDSKGKVIGTASRNILVTNYLFFSRN